MDPLSLAPRALSHAEREFERTLADLCGYLEFPAISSDPAHRGDVYGLATRVQTDLRRLGFEAHVRELEGALPLVAASRKSEDPEAPTLLIYGHIDLQPVAGEAWDTPPHQATRRSTPDGERLYARGAADDMGGWVSHLAALRAWIETAGNLPLSVQLVLEGEEEIGSPNLERYMDTFPEDFTADVMVLTDCENPSVDLPGLTTSLRGLYEVDIECRALDSDVHSGIWGNMAPDVSTALCRAVAHLVDDWGRPKFGRTEPNSAFKESAERVPLTTEVIRGGAHLAAGIEPLPLSGRSPAEWLWRQPALTILSTTLPRPEAHKNALRAAAKASLSIRVPPGKTRQDLRGELEKLLSELPSSGVAISLHEHSQGASSWLYEPRGPAFDAARRAYERVWGHPLTEIGIGGSIPFVALFGRRYAHLPLILNGVMDPLTGAHGPNESLHLGVLRKAILTNVWLYAELAAELRKEE